MVYYYRRITALILIGLLALFPCSGALAANPTVTITVSAWTVGTPGGLTITYINNDTLQVDWTKGDGAVNTMVRAKYGTAPESRTDGYLVYYGEGVTADDTSVDIDNTINPLYYRAWSEDVGGTWETTGTISFFEEGGMTLIFFVMLAIGVTWIGTKWRFYGLNLMGAIAWVIFALYIKANPPLHLAEGDSVHTALWVLLWGVAFMVALAGLGRGINRSRKWDTGEEQITGGFKWQLPEWMKWGGENEYQGRDRNVEADNLEYRRTLRQAYRSGEFGNRRRRQ